MVKAEQLKIESRTVGARITKVMYDKILELLPQNAHVSISDYLRDLVRRDLEAQGAKSHG